MLWSLGGLNDWWENNGKSKGKKKKIAKKTPLLAEINIKGGRRE